jgi:uridine kinase
VKIIGICGGSCSGKTTLAHQAQSRLGTSKVPIVFQDNYYIDQSHQFKEDGGNINFDHPISIDFELMAKHLKMLKKGKSIEIPQYDFKAHKRIKETIHLDPKEKTTLLVDGTLILANEKVRNCLDFSVFLEIDEKTRFQRRQERDTKQRGRSLEGVVKQFRNHVGPMHAEFVEPSKAFATQIFSGPDKFDQALNVILLWAK